MTLIKISCNYTYLCNLKQGMYLAIYYCYFMLRVASVPGYALFYLKNVARHEDFLREVTM